MPKKSARRGSPKSSKKADNNTLIVCFLVIVLIAIAIFYLIKRNKDVKEGFESEPMELNNLTEKPNPKGGDVVIVLFYVDWCPHCVSTKPHFQKLMAHNNENINGKVLKVAMVNCEKNPELAEAAGVEGYPTIQLELNGKRHNYDGERTEAGFMSYIKNMLS